MAELVADAKRRLDEALSTTFNEERARYDELLPGQGVLSDLAELRARPRQRCGPRPVRPDDTRTDGAALRRGG